MASWAAVAKAAVEPAPFVAPPAASSEGLSVVVVDANAIISGVRLEGIADRAITIPEVLAEVRDKQSRAYLASLPFGIEACEPDELSVKTGALVNGVLVHGASDRKGACAGCALRLRDICERARSASATTAPP